MKPSKPYKQRILEYLRQAGAQGATNARIKKQTGIPSHQQVYILTQNLARKKEITAKKEGGQWIFTISDNPSPADFEGKWLVVSSPDFDQEFLETTTPPNVSIKVTKHMISGTFEIGLTNGSFSGRLEGKRVLFSFEAMDELDFVHGAGTVSLQDNLLIFRLLYHEGDEWELICKRNEPN